MEIQIPKENKDPALPEKIEALEAEIVKRSSIIEKHEKGFERLEALLQTDFTPEKINGYIKDLCEASDTKMTRDGDSYQTPNWDARKNGLDRVLSLLRYSKTKEMSANYQPPIKMVFNVVNAVPKDDK